MVKYQDILIIIECKAANHNRSQMRDIARMWWDSHSLLKNLEHKSNLIINLSPELQNHHEIFKDVSYITYFSLRNEGILGLENCYEINLEINIKTVIEAHLKKKHLL